MPYPSQVYATMLNGLLLSITPALPSGTAGTRPPVGNPEHIPDITFITRELRAGDGIEPAERTRMNGFIRSAISYHQTFGLIPSSSASSNPRIIDSFDDILDHFHGTSDPIGRIRLVSHGNNAFVFMPIFEDGSWDVGLKLDRINAFAISDVAGLRATLGTGATNSPVIINGSQRLFDGIRAHNSNLLTPFGLNTSGSPSGNVKLFIDVVNDFYQLEHGTVLVTNGATTNLINATQKNIIKASLGILEKAIRDSLGAAMATPLDDLKNNTLSASPAELRFLPPINLTGTNITNINAALAVSPHVEADLRLAFGFSGSLMFLGFTNGHISALEIFNQNPNVLDLGGGNIVNDTISVTPGSDLEAYFHISADLFDLNRALVKVDGNLASNAQRTTIRNGMRAISNIIAGRITTPGGITGPRLTRLRDAIAGLNVRQSLITGGSKTYPSSFLTALDGSNKSINGTPGFRAKYNHFRSLMRPTSHCDIRGCLVGESVPFLDGFRAFMGTGTNLPNVSAPEWLQSFPSFALEFLSMPAPPIYPRIDGIVQNGSRISSLNLTAADVGTSFDRWKGLIEFDLHYSFITNLFSAGASTIFDFMTLEWRVFRTGSSLVGIPILKMEAERIDDIVSLTLGDLVVRFGIIFEIPTASRPSNAVRTRLTALQPHILTFKNIRLAIATAATATNPPTAGELTAFFNQLTTLATNITGIAGFAQPSSPLIPTSAPSPLTLANIQTFESNFQNHIDSLLNTDLNGFFTAVRTQIADPNAEIRYCLSIGIPILLQSDSNPPNCSFLILVSGRNSTQRTRFMSNAFKSWMKIQWRGTAAQATAMNALIDGLTITSNTQKTNARRASMLSEFETPTTDVAINPMPDFQNHIIPNTP